MDVMRHRRAERHVAFTRARGILRNYTTTLSNASFWLVKRKESKSVTWHVYAKGKSDRWQVTPHFVFFSVIWPDVFLSCVFERGKSKKGSLVRDRMFLGALKNRISETRLVGNVKCSRERIKSVMWCSLINTLMTLLYKNNLLLGWQLLWQAA